MGSALSRGWSLVGVAKWSAVGKATYGKKGYNAMLASLTAEDKEIPDMAGRVCLVTGANTGLGLATSVALASRRACVHMLCRNRERGEAAVAEVRRLSGNEDVSLHVVDVSLVGAVKEFAAGWLESGRPVHVLVNNAGVLLDKRTETAEGIETTMATALVPAFLLTALLLPALLQARAPPAPPLFLPRPPCVINVSSGGQYTVRLAVTDLECEHRSYDGAQQYAHAKRIQVMLSELWAERLRHAGIAVHAMHPGWALTPGLQAALPGFVEGQGGSGGSGGGLRSAEEGADTVVWLACAGARPLSTPGGKAAEAAAELLLHGGGFWLDRRPVPADFDWAGTRSTPAEFASLWEACEAACGFTFADSLAGEAVIEAAAGGAGLPAGV